jgi:ribosomal protein S18 acetylase RimI-like enzyme
VSETTIREFVPEDLPFLRAGFTSYLEEERSRVPVLGIADDFPDTYLPRLVEKVRDRDGFFLVAERHGARVGYVVVLPKDPDPWDQTRSRTAMIMELFVAPTHRRDGVGRRLFAEVERRCAARGLDWVTFGVMASNEGARRFYAAMGYQETYLFLGKSLTRGTRA